MEQTSFKCDICGKECDEIWTFSQYGNNPLKIKDENRYCKKHLEIANKEHTANAVKEREDS